MKGMITISKEKEIQETVESAVKDAIAKRNKELAEALLGYLPLDIIADKTCLSLIQVQEIDKKTGNTKKLKRATVKIPKPILSQSEIQLKRRNEEIIRKLSKY